MPLTFNLAPATHNIHLAESRGCPGAANAELAGSGRTPRARRSSGWEVDGKNAPPGHRGSFGAGWGAPARSPPGARGSVSGPRHGTPQFGGSPGSLLSRTQPEKAFRSRLAASSIAPADPAGSTGPGRRGPKGRGRVTRSRGKPWAPGEGRRDRRRGGGAPGPGRRRAGTQRRACAWRKLQPRARTGDRRALPGALTLGLCARGDPATPRKFPQSAPTPVPGREGAGPRHLYRHIKQRGRCGVCGWPPGARPDVNKPRGLR